MTPKEQIEAVAFALKLSELFDEVKRLEKKAISAGESTERIDRIRDRLFKEDK